MGGRSICDMCYETKLLNEMLSLILFVVYNNTLLGTFQNLITHHERTNDIGSIHRITKQWPSQNSIQLWNR
jgi:hypothetical protein